MQKKRVGEEQYEVKGLGAPTPDEDQPSLNEVSTRKRKHSCSAAEGDP